MVVRVKDRRWQDLEKDNIPLEKLTKHFETHNRSEGKSPATVYWYSRVLSYFHSYLREHRLPDTLGNLNIHVVRDFILYLQTKKKWEGHPYIPSNGGNLAAISVENYVRALRAFFSWLQREGYTADNILGQLRPPKVPQKMVQVLTQDEISRILSCIDHDTSSGSRDLAIIVTFLDTGARLSELTGLHMSDAYIDEGYLKVMGKGSKERMVPVGNTARRALQRYVFHFRPDPLYPDQDHLFLTLEGKPMTGNGVKLVFQRLAHKSGVRRLHVHLCRHTFATNYLINGGDVFSLQQILGHTSLEMVKRYVTLASAQVRVQHRKFSPMDRMNLGRVGLGRMSQNGTLNERAVKSSVMVSRKAASLRRAVTINESRCRNSDHGVAPAST
jgi:integrase/recombinase XerC/integrase/recombinase XerD